MNRYDNVNTCYNESRSIPIILRGFMDSSLHSFTSNYAQGNASYNFSNPETNILKKTEVSSAQAQGTELQQSPKNKRIDTDTKLSKIRNKSNPKIHEANRSLVDKGKAKVNESPRISLKQVTKDVKAEIKKQKNPAIVSNYAPVNQEHKEASASKEASAPTILSGYAAVVQEHKEASAPTILSGYAAVVQEHEEASAPTLSSGYAPVISDYATVNQEHKEASAPTLSSGYAPVSSAVTETDAKKTRCAKMARKTNNASASIGALSLKATVKAVQLPSVDKEALKVTKRPKQEIDTNLKTMLEDAKLVVKKKDVLGTGVFKSVDKAIIERNGLKLYEDKEVEAKKSSQPKPTAMVVYRDLNKPDAKIELYVSKKIQENPELSQCCPKVLYSDKGLVISKLANGGEAKNTLPKLTQYERAEVLRDSAVRGAIGLYKHGIMHEDIAPRNILIHHPKKWILAEKAVGRHVDTVYVPNSSRVLFKGGHKLTRDDLQRLEKHGITDVKVNAGKRPKGFLTDFGNSTIIEKGKVILTTDILPPDVTAPELMKVEIAPDNKKNLVRSEAVSNEKSIVFSLGQVIYDGLVNPGMNTSCVENKGERNPYLHQCNQRLFQRIEAAQSNSAGTVLEAHEKEKLERMDPRLADLISRALSYDPAKRPTLEEFEREFDKTVSHLNASEKVKKQYIAKHEKMTEVDFNDKLHNSMFKAETMGHAHALEIKQAPSFIKEQWMRKHHLSEAEFNKLNVPGSEVEKMLFQHVSELQTKLVTQQVKKQYIEQYIKNAREELYVKAGKEFESANVPGSAVRQQIDDKVLKMQSGIATKLARDSFIAKGGTAEQFDKMRQQGGTKVIMDKLISEQLKRLQA